MILKIERKQLAPDISVLQMAGRICLGSSCQQVEWTLAGLLQQNQKEIVFDLSEVSVLDSTGVGIIVMCYAKAKKAGGDLHIVCAKGMVEETLKMTNVDKIMPFYASPAEDSKNFQTA
jgi:anti-sigma B factor antagonist